MTFHCQLSSMNLEAQSYMSMRYLEFCLEKMEHIGQEARGAARRCREETSAKACLPFTYYISQISNHFMMILEDHLANAQGIFLARRIFRQEVTHLHFIKQGCVVGICNIYIQY